jgi:hypothetical protein
MGADGAERTPMDLVVLSTCLGGTVGTLRTLAPMSRFVIASPESLHLSHMDMSGLQGLENWNGNGLAIISHRSGGSCLHRADAADQHGCEHSSL